MLDRIRYALRGVFRRPTLEREMHDEMQHHLEQLMLGITTRRAPGVPHDVPVVRIRGMQRPKNSPKWEGASISYTAVREIERLSGTFASVAAWNTCSIAKMLHRFAEDVVDG